MNTPTPVDEERQLAPLVSTARFAAAYGHPIWVRIETRAGATVADEYTNQLRVGYRLMVNKCSERIFAEVLTPICRVARLEFFPTRPPLLFGTFLIKLVAHGRFSGNGR